MKTKQAHIAEDEKQQENTMCIHHYGVNGKPCAFYPAKCDGCRDYDDGLDKYDFTADGEC